MKTTNITIAGKQYPVQFDFQTLLNFEQITKKAFFETNFAMIVDRMAIIMAAVLTADEDSKLTVEMLKGKGDYDAVKEIIAAYTVVMELAGEYFKVPEVVKESEAKVKATTTNSQKRLTAHDYYMIVVGEITTQRTET